MNILNLFSCGKLTKYNVEQPKYEKEGSHFSTSTVRGLVITGVAIATLCALGSVLFLSNAFQIDKVLCLVRDVRYVISYSLLACSASTVALGILTLSIRANRKYQSHIQELERKIKNAEHQTTQDEHERNMPKTSNDDLVQKIARLEKTHLQDQILCKNYREQIQTLRDEHWKWKEEANAKYKEDSSQENDLLLKLRAVERQQEELKKLNGEYLGQIGELQTKVYEALDENKTLNIRMKSQASQHQYSVVDMEEEIKSLNAQMAQLRMKSTQDSDEISSLKSQLEIRNEEKDWLSKQVDKLDQQYTKISAQWRQQISDKEKLTKEKEAVELSIKQIRETNQENLSKIERKDNEIKRLNNKEKELQEKLKKLNSSLEEKENELKQKENELKKKESEINQNRELIQECEKKHASTLSALAEAKNNLDKIKTELEEKCQAFDVLQEQYASQEHQLKEKIGAMELAISEKNRELETGQLKLQASENQCLEATRKLEDHQKILEFWEKRIVEKNESILELREKVAQLERQILSSKASEDKGIENGKNYLQISKQVAPGDYSLNFLWINLNPQDRKENSSLNIFGEGKNAIETTIWLREDHLSDLKAFEKAYPGVSYPTWEAVKAGYSECFVYKVIEWAKLHPDVQINVWFDSSLVTRQAYKNTQDILSHVSKCTRFNLNLRDIRTIPRIEDKDENDLEYSLHPALPVYFRVDLCKALIIDHMMTEGPKFAAAIDIDFPPLTPGELFDEGTLQCLNQKTGFAFLELNNAFENGFYVFNRDFEGVQKAHNQAIFTKLTTKIKDQIDTCDESPRADACIRSELIYAFYSQFLKDQFKTFAQYPLKKWKGKIQRSQFHGSCFAWDDHRKELAYFRSKDGVFYTYNGRDMNTTFSPIKALSKWYSNPLYEARNRKHQKR